MQNVYQNAYPGLIPQTLILCVLCMLSEVLVFLSLTSTAHTKQFALVEATLSNAAEHNYDASYTS